MASNSDRESFAESVYIAHELMVRGDGNWRPWDQLLDVTKQKWLDSAEDAYRFLRDIAKGLKPQWPSPYDPT